MVQAVITREKIEEFLQKLQLDGKSRDIIAEYTRNLNRLYQTAEENQYVLDKKTLEKWRREQLQQGITMGTVTNRTVKINHFLRYLGLEELCFPAGNRQDLRNMQFGNLTAIEPTARKSSDRSIYWKCRCTVCGKEKEVPANQLLKGAQTSCGCEKALRLQKTNGYLDGTCLKRVFSDKINRNNTSGHKGVYWKRDRWAAAIQYKKKTYYLGSYDKIEDAIRARDLAEEWVREDAEKLLEQAGSLKNRNKRRENMT